MATIRKGTASADKMLGDATNEIFSASAGNDTIWGAGGSDVYILTGNLADYSVKDLGNGSYEIRDMRAGAPDGTDIVRDIEVFQFANTTLNLRDMLANSFNRIAGTDAGESLSGTIGRDRFYGAGGNDHIWGGAGTDTAVYSGALTDYAVTRNTDGTFTIRDIRAPSSTVPRDGTDTVRDVENFQFSDTTVSLSQLLSRAYSHVGTAGAETLNGTAYDDVMLGGAGNDHIWGGTAGNDTAVFSGRLSDYGIVDNKNGSYSVIDLRSGSPDGTDIVRSIEQFRFSDQTVSLTSFLNNYRAAATNAMVGTGGNDVLRGTAANDVLVGNGGNDHLWGGKAGNDTVVFSGKFSDYVVTDNDEGSYTIIDMRAGSPDGTDIVRDVEQWRFSDQTVSTANILSGRQSLVLTQTGTGGDDFITAAFANGFSGAHTNDLLKGMGGNDTLRGGPGSDVLIGDSGGAAATPAGSGTPVPTVPTDLTNFQIGYNTSGTVVFKGETAGYQNALGLYKITADGYVYGVQVLFANASVQGSGGNLIAGQSAVSVDLAAGDRIGFFVVPNGYAQPGMPALLSDTSGTFRLETASGAPGNINSGQPLKLVHVSATGVETDIHSQYGTSIFHSIPGANGGLNPDHFVHVTGVTQLADGSVQLGFEDLWGGGDRDFDDSVFSFNIGFANTMPTSASSTDAGNDQLHGGAGNDTLMGEAGNDTLEGGTGADTIIGGTGSDTADYSRAAAAVTVDLISGGTGGEAAGDTYSSIERVDGSAFGDTIRGTNGTDLLSGLDGNDRLEGRGGDDVLRGGAGADTIDGGLGFDTATYFESATGVVLNLATGGSGGEAAGDVYIGIERVQGSNAGGDNITGSAANDQLFGYGGDDTLAGDGGNDLLVGDNGRDSLMGGEGNDALFGQNDADTLDGGAGNDSVSGGAGDDIFIAGAGNDQFLGGDGTDTLQFSGSFTNYTVTATADGHVVIEDLRSGHDGIDTANLIERFAFTDGILDVQTMTFTASSPEAII